jgi:hypothetical protein
MHGGCNYLGLAELALAGVAEQVTKTYGNIGAKIILKSS